MTPWTLGFFSFLVRDLRHRRGEGFYCPSSESLEEVVVGCAAPQGFYWSHNEGDLLTQPEHMRTNLESRFLKEFMSLIPGVSGWVH